MSTEPSHEPREGAEPRYPYLHVECTGEAADPLSAALFELGATGVEERDQTTYVKGPAGDRVLLVASFDSHEDALEAQEALTGVEGVSDVSLHEVIGDAWRDAWKAYYEPFDLTPHILVRPPWKEAAAQEGKQVLVLEPGRAFGTGLHATTSLVASMLDEHRAELAGKEVCDAGCGSGILSFVALLLGAKHVVAFDIDGEVLDTVRENAERNAMSGRMRVFAGTVDDVEGTFPWVVANIESKILDPIADALVARVAPGGHLLLSGILTAEEEWMTTRFTGLARKLRLVGTKHMSTGGERAYDKDGWVSLHLVAED